MYTLSNFCRVCLKSDKNLIDLAHIENEPNETLITKLQQCVSEVEWDTYKPLLCHPCIKRLNLAYAFKKQCIQSASVMKSYIDLVQQAQQKQNDSKCETVPQSGSGGAIMLLPNQKYVKILVGGNTPNQSNSFQNVFLNLIPATSITTNSTENSTVNNKDTNENVFMSVNNSGNKFVPIAPAPDALNQKQDNQIIFNESKTEEVSVEIDPMCFTDFEENGESNLSNNQEPNDWEDEISSTKIEPVDYKEEKQDFDEKFVDEKYIYDSFVPILPKCDDFVNSGQHFLYANTENSSDLTCETCLRNFSSLKHLKQHIREFHLNNSLTLKDFTNEHTTREDDDLAEGNPEENGEYKCNLCERSFTSTTGLIRHNVRKHKQKNRTKYFIKGMKNARCDICNRAFSTNSYMQLHRKLHLRDEKRYKYKIFGVNPLVNHLMNKNDNSGDSDSQEPHIKTEIDLDDVKIEQDSEGCASD